MPEKRDSVTVEGTVSGVNYKPIRSDIGGVEGVARQVSKFCERGGTRSAILTSNLSVPFLLSDHDGNLLCVSAIHEAKGLDLVMQTVWTDQSWCDKILTFGTHLVLRGPIQRVGSADDRLIMNPTKVALTTDGLGKETTTLKVLILSVILIVVGTAGLYY